MITPVSATLAAAEDLVNRIDALLATTTEQSGQTETLIQGSPAMAMLHQARTTAPAKVA